MKNDNIIVGLDIGTTKIACFIGQRGEDNKLRILGFGKSESIGVERGEVRNIISTAESVRKAVKEASDQANRDVHEVYVGIAGQNIKSQKSVGSIMIPAEHRFIMQEDVDRLISDQYKIMLNPGEEIVHVFPQSYEVDNSVLQVDPVGVSGKCLRCTFHIVTANGVNIRNIKTAVEEAGLHVKGLVLEPIASSYAVLDERDQSAGVALVDIGGGTTDIAIFRNEVIIHTSVLPLAGNAITTDIREGCKILKSQAETLKTKYGSCLPSNVNGDDVISIPGIRGQPSREISMKTLASIIKARVRFLLEQVGLEIADTGYSTDHLLAGLVLTGGGSQLKHIKELSELIIHTSTRIGTPNEHLEPNQPNSEEYSHPMYATGIGLVLYGLSRECDTDNDTPEEEDLIEETPIKEEPSNVNIFDGLDDSPVAEPIERSTPPEPPAAPEPKKKKEKRERKRFGAVVLSYLDRLASDDNE